MSMELNGKGIIQVFFLIGCATLLALLLAGAWVLKKVLPDTHPMRSRLSPEKLLHIAKVLAATLIAVYFVGAVILYG
ncbi:MULTISPECIES: hypothetical protein [Variovorax]|uniref:hypothetical protein n=1 Tax=Variovorax TaxID=34072 RepID=UPI00286A34F3|nr:hypothetical protein [Variovorax sp. 3319]